MQKPQKLLLFFLGTLVIFGASFAIFRFKDKFIVTPLPPAVPYEATPAPQENIPTSSQSPTASSPTAPSTPVATATLPAEVNLKIPFTSQAPNQNWSAPYQEFCEEASTLMVASYINNQPINGPADADKKMLAIMDFEMKKFGYYQDTTADETATILREYFNLPKVEVVSDPTIEQIKTALAEGKAVIMPEAGRQLGNPNFQTPGPLYHMLVIKGYRKNGDFITNDPGTRKGADYIYKASTIMNANHDWNGGNVDTGRKVMIIVG
ncbi:MAG: C39 family peptidase [Parcubacteria group bacterium]|jgi:hypothetical protein